MYTFGFPFYPYTSGKIIAPGADILSYLKVLGLGLWLGPVITGADIHPIPKLQDHRCPNLPPLPRKRSLNAESALICELINRSY